MRFFDIFCSKYVRIEKIESGGHDASGRWWKRKKLESIGEARRVEEGARKMPRADRLYKFEECEAEDEPEINFVGAVVEVHGLVKAAQYNGRRAKVLAKCEKENVNDEQRFEVQLLKGDFAEDEKIGSTSADDSSAKQLKVKAVNMRFLNSRREEPTESSSTKNEASSSSKSPIRTTAKGSGKGSAVPSPALFINREKDEEPISPTKKEIVPKKPAQKKKPELSSESKSKLESAIVDCLEEEDYKLNPAILENLLRTRPGANQLVEDSKKTVESILDFEDALTAAVEGNSTKKSKNKKKKNNQKKVAKHWLVKLFEIISKEKAKSDMKFYHDGNKNAFGLGSEAPKEDEKTMEPVSDDEEEIEEEEVKEETPVIKSAVSVESEKNIEEVVPDKKLITTPDKTNKFSPPARAVVEEKTQEQADGEKTEKTGAEKILQHQSKKTNAQKQLETKQEKQITYVLSTGEKYKIYVEQLLEKQQQFRNNMPMPHQIQYSTGTQFFLPPWEIYFTQDTIKNTFTQQTEADRGNSSGSEGEGTSTRSLSDTLNEMLTGAKKKRDIEMMKVVSHEGYYYSTCNRRLAVYMLMYMMGRCKRLKVELVDKDHKEVNWKKRFTTQCYGEWIKVRQTGEVIGRTLRDTSFKHPTLEKMRKSAN